MADHHHTTGTVLPFPTTARKHGKLTRDRSRQRSSSGRLLPPLHPFDRIQLSRWRAPRAWIALADDLDTATGALAEAAESGGDVDAALYRWERAALAAMMFPKNDPPSLRAKLRLAEVFLGVVARDPAPAEDLGELALRAIDRGLCVEHSAQKERWAQRIARSKRRATGRGLAAGQFDAA